jgi:hypothetical protein
MERKRLAVAVAFLIICILIIEFSLSEEIETELEVTNTPPILLKNIPNQSWPDGQNLTNAFDLDDYFVDLNGDPLDYSFSPIDDISVSILPSGIVSFYPPANFSGIRNITFYASDNASTTSSNLVFLFVGADEEPPQWSLPYKNRVRVYQSSYVNFTTRWTDNLALKSYYFSINQGSEWANYSEINFSGLENTSLYGLQISAAPGGVVYWMFCASDTNYNSNCTSIQNFTVEIVQPPPSNPESPSGGAGGGYGAGSSGGAVAARQKSAENFTVDPDYFKVSLKQGTTDTRILKITNIGNSELPFEISVLGVEGMVFLSDQKFSILPGELKAITLDFTAGPNLNPEQYFGTIIVQSYETRQIPIVIDVNDKELMFGVDVAIPQKYKQVMPGELVAANISILNLKDVIDTNITLYLALKDLYGNIYDSSQEELMLSYALSLERNLTIPGGADEGQYLFYARAFSGQAQAIDSDIFEVGSKFFFLASLRYSFVFILIFFLVIIAFILMVVYSRSKEKERVLSLYLMLNELKNLVKSGEFEKATNLYIRIKRAYGEKVSEEEIKNADQLKEEIRKLSLSLKKDVKDTEGTEKEDKTENVKGPINEGKKDGLESTKKEDIKKEIKVQKEKINRNTKNEKK